VVRIRCPSACLSTPSDRSFGLDRRALFVSVGHQELFHQAGEALVDN